MNGSKKFLRHSLRIPGFDYSEPGPYFVTICAHRGAHLFGKISGNEISLNEFGRIVQACWNDLPNHYPYAQLDTFTVMLNHVHGIIALFDPDPVGAGFKPVPTNFSPPAKRHGLPEIVRAFKTFSSRRINELRYPSNVGAGFKPAPTDLANAATANSGPDPVWQRNYYEHIIRDETSLDRIREYIFYNPLSWALDRENPSRQGEDPFDRWLDSFKNESQESTFPCMEAI